MTCRSYRKSSAILASGHVIFLMYSGLNLHADQEGIAMAAL